MIKNLPEVATRFIKYTKIDTQSAYVSDTYPSTLKQLNLAKVLEKELIEIGLENVHIDQNGYVFGTLSANTDEVIPKIGFLAHMDTTPEVSGKDVNPQIIFNYSGGDIVLNKEKNIILKEKDSPELKDYLGNILITSDGTTLLGVDDKAGIAEIITAINYLIKNPKIKHGTVKVAFTPDEEVGMGVAKFDIEKFGVDFAYTLDGGPIGEISYETFNAAKADIIINGINVHPGLAKDKMINSIEVLMELSSMIPVNEKPQYTEGREGYYHLLNVTGDVQRIETSIYVRDHDKSKYEKRKEILKNAVDFINKKYGYNIIEMNLYDQYFNMKEMLENKMHIIDASVKATKEIGIEPFFRVMRGGTDGAWLTYQGLPTPNIFTGGHNYHSVYEFVSVDSMEKAKEVIIKIVELYGLQKN